MAPATIELITPTRSDGAIALSWTVPSDGGSPLLRYDIECSNDSGATYSSCFANITPSGAEGETFTTTLSGVNNYQAYYLRLRAVNSVGNSNWNGVEVMPPSLPSNVASVSVVRDGFSITATWDASEATDSYLVELYAWGPGPALAQTLTGATQTFAGFTIANFNKSHTVSVTSKNAFGSGERTDSPLVRMPNPPAAPASVSGTRSANGASIAATWSSVDGATSYDLRYSADDGASWTTASTGLTAANTTISDLSATSAYILSARASKTYDSPNGSSATLTGEWGSSSATIHAPPGKTTNFAVSGAQLSDTTLSWTRPSFTGTGSDDLTYNVYCRRNSSRSWAKIESGVSDTSDGNVQVVVSDDRCSANFAEVAITAVNVVEGEFDRIVRNH